MVKKYRNKSTSIKVTAIQKKKKSHQKNHQQPKNNEKNPSNHEV